MVAKILAQTQAAMGLDSRLHTALSGNLWSQPLRYPALTSTAVLDATLVSSDQQLTQFSLYRDRISTIGSRILAKDSIVHLHWVNGALSRATIRNLVDSGRTVVWTLHDMNPFTGGCHHSHNCTAYRTNCKACPQVRPAFQGSVAVNLERKRFLTGATNLAIVSPTQWIADMASESLVLKDLHSRVIRNPISNEYFREREKSASRKLLGLSADSIVFVSAASNLRDPNKNVRFLVQEFEEASSHTSGRAQLLLAGKQGAKWHRPESGVIWLGELSSLELNRAYSASDLLLSASLAESAGMTVVEAAAVGLPTLALSNGGVASFVKDGLSGLLAHNEIDFRLHLESAIRGETDLTALGQAASINAQNHRPEVIAQEYLSLYKTLSNI